MKCSKCQFENPDEIKFCGECGAKLEKPCPGCGHSNPPQFKFCGECGQPLAHATTQATKDLSFEEKLAKIQRYLPEGLTQKILSQRDRIEGERKQVTVMFCDMEGFTPLADRLGPEGVYSLMDQVYEILIHKVNDFGGTVNELTGDGIMALFGAPIALEDAPQRAIRSGLAIHSEITRFSERMTREKGITPLKMRVGIHSGPVVVGTVGNDLRVEFKALGDTVNLASRMEGLAEPGTTYVTEDTFKLTEGLFRFEALGEKEVKGKDKPVKVYRVIAPSSRRTRFDVSAERGLTPFVGRERELELLLDSFERAKGGRGQAFSIMGEAGVGKSRLLYEFRKSLSNEGAFFLEGKCLSFSRGAAYHPIIDLLKSYFDVMEKDGDSEIRNKAMRGLQELKADETSTLPYLLELLSVKQSGLDKIMMSPESRKDRIMGAVNRIIIQGSEQRPLVIAIEDLHWIDQSSEEYLTVLLDSISGARVLLILTYRPEFIPSWRGKSYHNNVTLNRLSNRESLAMVTHLLGTRDIDRGFEEFILEKTEGIPFFVEEFIKAFRDLGIIEERNNTYHMSHAIQDFRIPSTIHDVIMARVDALTERAKNVIQTGSVIEREFSHELLKHAMEIPEQELISCLSALKDAELIYERGLYPQSTYIFKHALTKEVVYDSILDTKKKALHGKIGRSIEKLFHSSVDEHYAGLAEHFIAAEEYEKGADYMRRAGRKAEKAGSLSESCIHAQKRVACLEKLPQTEATVKALIDARTALGLYLFQLFRIAEAKEAVEPIIEPSLKLNYKKRIAQIYTIIGTCECFVLEDLDKSFEYLEEALKISEGEKDMVSGFFANAWLSQAYFRAAMFDKAHFHHERGLSLNIRAKNDWGIPVMKSSLSYGLNWRGKVQAGHQMTVESLPLAEKSGDVYSKACVYSSHGESLLCVGNLSEAETYFLKGIDLCVKIGWLYLAAVARQGLGEVYFALGEFEKSQNQFKNAMRLVQQSRISPSSASLDEVALARGKVAANKGSVDLGMLIRHVSKMRIPVYESWIRRLVAKVFLNIDDHHLSEAENWITQAIEMDIQKGMPWHLAQDYMVYSEISKRRESDNKAKDYLMKAIELFEGCAADGWVETTKKKIEAFS